MQKNFLICLVGLPASGKTTFSINLKDFIERNYNDYKVRIIDPDKIRDIITPDKFDYKKEQLVRKQNLNDIEKALKDGYIVISDDLNYYSSMRHDLKLIAENLNLNFFIIQISTPLNICLKWNKNRGELIPNKILKKIKNKFDSFDKYKWDYPIASVDMSKVKDFNQTFKNLMGIFFHSNEDVYDLKTKEESVKQSSNQYNEMLDKITRNIVGELLKKKEFNVKKKKILDCRKRFIRIYLNKSLNESLIEQTFKKYLEHNLNLKMT
jgi:O-phosphoseryl-tRNA(Sec) kinase